jgi:hypothetical protein
VEADYWAKAYLETARNLPRCYQVPYKPWSIWHKGKKMMKLESDIHNMVQGQCAMSYWKGKDKIDPALLDYVAWDAIGDAMRLQSRSNQRFITKQTVGIAGVGKWMHRRRQWPTLDCPRCGLQETTEHVLSCKGTRTDKVWDCANKN